MPTLYNNANTIGVKCVTILVQTLLLQLKEKRIVGVNKKKWGPPTERGAIGLTYTSLPLYSKGKKESAIDISIFRFLV